MLHIKPICVGHHYTLTNTNNINKALSPLQTIGDKDEPNEDSLRQSYCELSKST